VNIAVRCHRPHHSSATEKWWKILVLIDGILGELHKKLALVIAELKVLWTPH